MLIVEFMVHLVQYIQERFIRYTKEFEGDKVSEFYFID